MCRLDLRRVRRRRRDVEFFKIQSDAFEMLLVLQTVDIVFTNDARSVGKRIVGTVDDRRRTFPTQDRLISLGAPIVFAVLPTNEICGQNDNENGLKTSWLIHRKGDR